MEDNFDPEKVGSIMWNLGVDGNWKTQDHTGMQGDTLETIEIGDFEKLLAMYLEVKEKYDWLRRR